MTKPAATEADAVKAAYREGAAATRAGKPDHPRPHYPISAERHAWSAGWNDTVEAVAWRQMEEAGS